MDIKKMFKLQGSRKSQAKTVDAWYWNFESLISESVQVKVTTYHEDIRFAWDELEKAIGFNTIIYKSKRKKQLQKMGVSGKRK